VNKNRGLGRGLGALFPGARPPSEPAASRDEGVAEIEIDRIDPNVHQPRRHFDEQRLHERAQAIAANGLLAPIVVRRSAHDELRCEISAGERRWRAA